jgi:uncharacterized protein involved in exopolysaccharide biosynthesis
VTNTDDLERLDLRELVRTLWRRRLWIFACVIVCGGIGATIAFLSTPVYRAVVTLAPANVGGIADSLGSRLSQLGGLASFAGIDLGSSTNETDVALAVLKSRQFTEKFILENQLMPILFAEQWDASAKDWKADLPQKPTPWRAYRFFSGAVLTITQDKRTSFVTVQVDWRNGAQAASWANGMAHRLNEEMRERAIRESDASIGFLERELQKTTTVTTRDAISRLIESQIKQRMLANVMQEYAFRVVDKAMPPDQDSPIRPRKLWLLAGGLFAGLGLGVCLVLFTGWIWPENRSAQSVARQ